MRSVMFIGVNMVTSVMELDLPKDGIFIRGPEI